MNPSSTPLQTGSGSSQDASTLHQGYQLESGLLARLREWVDVFPWLRLLRTLRIAGSPTMILISAVTLGLWGAVQGIILPAPQQSPSTILLSASEPSPQTAASELWFQVPMLQQTLNATAVLSNWQQSAEQRPGQSSGPDNALAGSLLSVLWTIVVWSFAALLFLRQGALLTAGRPMQGALDVSKLSIRRILPAWLSALVPFACVVSLAVVLYAAGVAVRVGGGSDWIQFPAALVIVITAVPCGILAFGANFAIPLSWAAIANEPVADPLDSLSRGYEYLYRRPAFLAIYAMVSLLLMLLVELLITGIVTAASGMVSTTLHFASAPVQLTALTHRLLSFIPVATLFAFFWALVGGSYLLLRQDAGGQHVEDLWTPSAVDSPNLPQLPQ